MFSMFGLLRCYHSEGNAGLMNDIGVCVLATIRNDLNFKLSYRATLEICGGFMYIQTGLWFLQLCFHSVKFVFMLTLIW